MKTLTTTAGRDARRDRCSPSSSASGWAATAAPTPAIRPVLDALPDHPAVRLPGAGPGAVRRQPVHRDRRRGRRTPCPVAIKLIADGIRACPPTTVEAARVGGHHHLADDQQGAAADGARGRRAGHQPGPDLRAVDGRHRRPGRRGRARLLRGRRLLPGDSCSARGWRPASPSPRSGSCSTGSPSTPRPATAGADTGGDHRGDDKDRTRSDAGRVGRGRSALALAGCGGGEHPERADARRRRPGSDCGKFNIAINPWVGYEASRARRRLRRQAASSAATSSTRTSRKRSPGRAWAPARSTW